LVYAGCESELVYGNYLPEVSIGVAIVISIYIWFLGILICNLLEEHEGDFLRLDFIRDLEA